MSTKHAWQATALRGVGTACLGALLAACTGMVAEGDEAGNSGVSGGSGAASGVGGVTLQGENPGSKTMHRLNSAEYNYTVADVLGTALAPAGSLWSNEEALGFDNIASVLRVDDKQFQRYFEAAAAIAEDVFGNAQAKARFVTCAAIDDSACVQSVVTATGLRLFRRPLSAEEVATYEKVYAQARTLGQDHDPSLKLVLRALLSSAEFLYRIEFDPDPASLTPHAVSPYELASRASYFLWSSAPDDELLNAAADGSLADQSVLGAAVDRMLADPRAERFIRNFSGQWLGARKVPMHGVNPSLFPEWTPQLASAMAEEVYQLFGEFVRTERPWTEFLKADVNFVDTELAALYGVAPPAEGVIARVEAPDDARYGFLGTAAFLAMSSYEYRTAPTLRGRWILINLLCTPPADPPANVPPLDSDPNNPDAAEQNVRERLAEHRTNPVCAGCHAALDPWGEALENFDAIGKFRTTYRNGSPVDPATTLADGSAIFGLEGVAESVSSSADFTRCISEKLFTYGLGRAVEASDRPYLEAVRSEWLGDAPTLRRLIRSLVLADTFRFRHAAQ